MKGLKTPPKAKGLEQKEKLFCEFYCVNGFNLTKAAISAGYSVKTARATGSKVFKRPLVKDLIDKLLKEKYAGLDTIKKIVSDVAVSNITDYYTKKVAVVTSHKIKVPLQQVIDSIKEEIIREELFCERMGYTEQKYDDFMEALESRRERIIRYEIELQRNPAATRVIDSDPEIEYEMHLDMNALIADKEKGKVKKLKYGKDGLELELYSIKDAAEQIIKMEGGYEKDNRQKAEQPKQVIKWGGKEIEF